MLGQMTAAPATRPSSGTSSQANSGLSGDPIHSGRDSTAVTGRASVVKSRGPEAPSRSWRLVQPGPDPAQRAAQAAEEQLSLVCRQRHEEERIEDDHERGAGHDDAHEPDEPGMPVREGHRGGRPHARPPMRGPR